MNGCQSDSGLLSSLSGAEFSPCRRYRYALWRRWNEGGKTAVFIGLNPSTADESVNDRTVTRCINFSKAWGCSRYVMLNAYGWRDTDPDGMFAADDPIGDGNNEAIVRYTTAADMVIAAWGTLCPIQRELQVLSLVRRPIHCLKLTKHGRPWHPLYVKGAAQLIPFNPLGETV